MKKCFLCILIIFLFPLHAFAQSFEIPEGYININLDGNNWENQKGTYNGVIQYDYTRDYSRYVSIRVSEDNFTKKIIDSSALKLNDQYLDEFSKQMMQGLGDATLLNKKAYAFSNMSTICLEYIRKNDPSFNVPVYYRMFFTIKNGKALHFIFIYLNEQDLNNNRQIDINTIQNITFTKNTLLPKNVKTNDNKLKNHPVGVIVLLIIILFTPIFINKFVSPSKKSLPKDKIQSDISVSKSTKQEITVSNISTVSEEKPYILNFTVHESSTRPKYTKEDILSINDWRFFEKFVAGCFKEKGYNVTLTAATNDGGKDIIVKKNDIVTYIECKYWHVENNKTIGREIIQKLIGAAVANGVRHAIVISTAKYHDNAINEAHKAQYHGFHIALWNIHDLLDFIN